MLLEYEVENRNETLSEPAREPELKLIAHRSKLNISYVVKQDRSKWGVYSSPDDRKSLIEFKTQREALMSAVSMNEKVASRVFLKMLAENIKQVVADHTATRGYTPFGVKDAMDDLEVLFLEQFEGLVSGNSDVRKESNGN